MISTSFSASSVVSLQRLLINNISSELTANIALANLYSKYHLEIMKSITSSFAGSFEVNGIKSMYEVSKLLEPISINHKDYLWVLYPCSSSMYTIYTDGLYPIPRTLMNGHQGDSRMLDLEQILHLNPEKVVSIKPKLQREILVAVTTCNQIKMTLVTLSYLTKALDNLADIVIMDDASSDQTAIVLRQKGYFVMQSEKPQGLTFHWNKAYSFAILLGYKYVIFMNNDVLVPQGALKEMAKDIAFVPLLVPLSTLAGAGHNPNQVS